PDTSTVTPTPRRRQPSAPPSAAKTQIARRNIAFPSAARATDSTVAVLARPPSQHEIEKSNQTRALNPHSPIAPPTQTPPAVSSLEAFRTPASVHALAPVIGRRPNTLNEPSLSGARAG